MKGTPFLGPRFAFTLLEVLIALALSLILVAAVYQALSLHWRYSIAGQADVQQSQLARALLHRIETDIRSVIYREEAPATDASASDNGSTGNTTGASTGATGSTTGAAGTTDSGTTTDTATALDPADAYATTNTGLFGNAQTLLLHVSKPSRQLNYSSLASMGVSVRTSDLQTVAYFLSGASSGGLQNVVGTRQLATPAAGGDLVSVSGGLARLEGDRLTLSLADQQGNAGTLAGHTEILAPEVTGLQFQYYDGVSWYAAWDSVAYGGLPRAVEIKLELHVPSKGLLPAAKQAAGSTGEVYRLVVPLPLSKPVATSSAY